MKSFFPEIRWRPKKKSSPQFGPFLAGYLQDLLVRGGVLEDILGLEETFEVLGLGLEASSPRKLPSPRLEDSIIFLNRCNFVEKRQKPWGKLAKTFFCIPSIEDRLKKVFQDLFRLKKIFEDLSFFFWRTLAPVFLVLGLKHSCPWSREDLSSEGLSLALALDFFCVLGLGLEPCVLDSTSAFSPSRLFSHWSSSAQLSVGGQWGDAKSRWGNVHSRWGDASPYNLSTAYTYIKEF